MADDEPLISIILPGDPVGKGRPRARIVTPRGKPSFIHFYTPKDTEDYEQALAWQGKAGMRGRAPFDCALTVLVEAFVPIPASWSKPKRAAAVSGDLPAMSKPDADNYAKIALDGLNKIVWADDASVVSLQAIKRYSDFPRLRVSAWRWDDMGPSEPEMEI